jgi:hypothetical protein
MIVKIFYYKFGIYLKISTNIFGLGENIYS